MSISTDEIPAVLRAWCDRDAAGLHACCRRLAAARAQRVLTFVPDDLAETVAAVVFQHVKDREQLEAFVAKLPRHTESGEPVVYRDEAHALSRVVFTLANRLVKQYQRASARTVSIHSVDVVLVGRDPREHLDRSLSAARFWVRAAQVLSAGELQTLGAYRDANLDGPEAARHLGITPGAFRVRLHRILTVLRTEFRRGDL